jgi:ferritin heavy chain
MSKVRQNFHSEVEAAINRQINMELRASYVYQSMVISFISKILNAFLNAT